MISAIAVAALGAAGYGLYRFGMQRGMEMAARRGLDQRTAATATVPQSIAQGEEATRRHIAAGIKAGDIDPATGKKILYYHDPMVPGNKFDKPAKSPFMDMSWCRCTPIATPIASKVTVSPRIQQNLGVRTAVVTEGVLSPQVVGGRQHRVQRARSGGRAGARDRLCRAAACARDARSRAQGPAAGRAVRSRLDCRAGRISLGAAHGKAPIWPARRWSAPAHAAGRHE